MNTKNHERLLEEGYRLLMSAPMKSCGVVVESRALTEGGVPAIFPPIGLEENRKGLQLAIDWALDQTIIPHRLSVDELFDDVTATLA